MMETFQHKTGLIFDMDGTLLESMTLWHTLGERYLKGRGIHDVPHDMNETLYPMDMHQSARWIKTHFGLPDSPEDIIEGVESMLAAQYRHHIEPKAGTIDFLERLAETGRYRMCLATATARHLVEPALERTGLAKYFEFILTTKEVGVGKHRPDIFLKALAQLDLPLSEAVVFEDALYAVETAKHAGFSVVAVADVEARAEQEAIRRVADAFVERIEDALPLFLQAP